jgi:DNA-directed RNA polymerase sigma subunit (sigma70/sigma32)
MGISRERVRQLKNRAIEKLQEFTELDSMLMFLD